MDSNNSISPHPYHEGWWGIRCYGSALPAENLGETLKEVGIRACGCGCLNGGKHGRRWESECVDVGVSEIRDYGGAGKGLLTSVAWGRLARLNELSELHTLILVFTDFSIHLPTHCYDALGILPQQVCMCVCVFMCMCVYLHVCVFV